MDAYLVDTTVLVYLHDPRAGWKQERALEVVDRLIDAGAAVLSVQCLTEFFRAVRWRLPEPLSHTEAFSQLQRFATACRVFDLTPAVVTEACRGTESHQLPLWDALIWASAKLNGIRNVLTEDTHSTDMLEGVRFTNPFAHAFDVASLA